MTWATVGGIGSLIALILTGVGTYVATKSWTASQAARIDGVKQKAYDEGYREAKNLYEPQIKDAERRATAGEARAAEFERLYLGTFRRSDPS